MLQTLKLSVLLTFKLSVFLTFKLSVFMLTLVTGMLSSTFSFRVSIVMGEKSVLKTSGTIKGRNCGLGPHAEMVRN